ncbi:MAG: EamA family transporter RarD [Acidimicrobiia bacterium]|nr:EamA family transporter RarD [Acidimicrobiia bacterium]
MRKGLFAGITAYLLWALTPFYWRLIGEVPALEVLGHRILWALPVLVLTLVAARRWGEVRAVSVRDRKRLAIAAVAVTANWGLFIWAIFIERVVEASLAYYINPFLSVAVGVVVFREHLSRLQRIALGLAGTGVLVMVVAEGIVPWMAFAIAVSFATYGAVKKTTSTATPVVALTWEVVFAYPLALAGFVFLIDVPGAFGGDAVTTWVLVGAGAVTVLPLVFFGAAVRSIPLAWVGMLQFITPTMLFLEGAFLFGEEVSAGRWLGFAFVWLAVTVFVTDAARRVRGSTLEASGST